MDKNHPLKLILAAESGPSGTWEFTGPDVVIIGRDPRSSVHPAEGVEAPGLSRFHASIEIGPNRAILRDLGSPGGTWLNGHLVGRREESEPRPATGVPVRGEGVELADGDIITLGCMWLHVSLTDATPERTAYLAAPNCPGCGRPLSRPATASTPDSLCDQCRSNPISALKLLKAGLARRINALAPLKGIRIERTLGRGATSAVFLVARKKNEEKLALKVMPPSMNDNEWARKSFLREAALGRALKHPNVTRMYESGRYAGVSFALMEYCSGGSSEEMRVAAGGRLPLEKALAIILPTLDGLDYIHNVKLATADLQSGRRHSSTVGLIHRDLKPANIFLGGPDGKTPKLADIGVAKFQGEAGSCNTRTGSVAGSPATMPRQQAINFKYAGPEVDVWAAAASLFKLLTGEYPRDFPRDRDPWQVVMDDKPRLIRSLWPEAPVHLAEAIDEALIDDPAIIHQTAVSFKTALLEAMAKDGIVVEYKRADGA